MPAYTYKCINCGVEEVRIAGIDDDTALCVNCGDLMLRLDEDIFRPYFTGMEVEEVREEKVQNG